MAAKAKEECITTIDAKIKKKRAEIKLLEEKKADSEPRFYAFCSEQG